MKSRFFRVVIWFSVILNLLFAFSFIRRKIYFATHNKPDTTQSDKYNTARSLVFDKLPIDSTDIVFIGDSITEGFPLSEMFPNEQFKNRGISANRSDHVLGRIPAILKRKPKKIFLEIGINDLMSMVSPDTLFRNYIGIIQLAKQQRVVIYATSILPVCMEYAGYNPAIIAFNKRLKEYCDKEKVQYIDVYTGLVKNGSLDNDYTFDGLHINVQGYRVWKDKIESLVK